MSTGPLTAPRSTPPPTHPRGMTLIERARYEAWRAGAMAIVWEAIRANASQEILKRLQAVVDAGPDWLKA